MKLEAKWIWKKQKNYNLYNDAVIARKSFKLAGFKQATAYVTADSFYRLSINGQWINDGPARAWPNHYKYDVIDVTSYLRQGENHVEIIASYYGCGDFHRVCQQAGLLAQFDVKLSSGGVRSIVSDSSWEISAVPALIPNTPKLSVQQGPYEYYNAGIESKGKFSRATELFDTKGGPWKGLNPRDVKLLTKKPVNFKRFMGGSIVRYKGQNHSFPAARLMFPGVIEAQSFTEAACGFATIIKVTKKCVFETQSTKLAISIDGKTNASGKYLLKPGRHLLLSFTRRLSDLHSPEGHEKEKNVRVICSERYKLINPLDSQYENPWSFIRLDQFAYVCDDMDWSWTLKTHPELRDKLNGYIAFVKKMFKTVKDQRSFNKILGEYAECLPSREMLLEDHFWKFSSRQIIGSTSDLVECPDALMYDNGHMTTVKPTADGDIELAYDLGEQRMGYYQLEMIADAGVEVQISAIEHIADDGGLQHTNMITTTLNGMHYITKGGLNKFVSLKRRGGRYVYITLRNQNKPVRIRMVRVIESTYPVEYIGSFSCSDKRLDQIWDISTRTLKLCMEDTFTDCPLYEQTLWVGDARNEALFAYPVFGATDIAGSCIDIAAQSLDRYPMVGAQLPSAWDCIIPVWSFLWCISVWDYYWYTGDKVFVKKQFRSIIRNFKGAEKYLNKDGLFSAKMWNLFDWSGIDQDQENVMHNSMFMVGAIDAALDCAKVVGEKKYDKWLIGMRKKLVKSLNALWNSGKKSYPDSIHADGAPSKKICQHTSFLSVLYNIADKKIRDQVAANTIKAKKGMTTVGSPFAILYLYEALEKIGADDVIMKSIYENYLPMLKVGATTVWETFPNSPWAPEGESFPTRSHCHAWSSAPAYFINRIVLGIRQTSPGGKSFDVSPLLTKGLTNARGTVASINGPINVSWQIDGKTLHIDYSGPETTKLNFVRNDSHKGLKVVVTVHGFSC